MHYLLAYNVGKPMVTYDPSFPYTFKEEFLIHIQGYSPNTIRKHYITVNADSRVHVFGIALHIILALGILWKSISMLNCWHHNAKTRQI